MAWLEQHLFSGHFKICFRWGGKKKRKSLPVTDAKSAEAILLRFEENVALPRTVNTPFAWPTRRKAKPLFESGRRMLTRRIFRRANVRMTMSG